MNRKVLFGLVAVFSGAMLICGCGKKTVLPDGKVVNGYKYDKEMVLGEYKGLELTKMIPNVNDEEIEQLKKEYLESYAEYTSKDSGIEMGDEVSVSIRAYVDSELVYDFYGEDDCYDLVIGDCEFGKAFDDAILGMKNGDEAEFSLEYSDDEEDATLAGNTVDYQIKIESVEVVGYPEVTEDFVKEEFECDSINMWEEQLSEEVLATKLEEEKQRMYEEVDEALLNNFKYNGFDKELYKEIYDSIIEEYEEYADFFDTDIQGVYDFFGISKEEVKEDAIRATKVQMALAAIADVEEIKLSNEEYSEKISEFIISNEYYDEEEVYDDYEKKKLEKLFLQEKVYDFIIENANVSTILAN